MTPKSAFLVVAAVSLLVCAGCSANKTAARPDRLFELGMYAYSCPSSERTLDIQTLKQGAGVLQISVDGYEYLISSGVNVDVLEYIYQGVCMMPKRSYGISKEAVAWNTLDVK